MKFFKLTFIATCILSSQTIAQSQSLCPPANTVKTALMNVIHFRELSNKIKTEIHDPNIVNKPEMKIFDFDIINDSLFLSSSLANFSGGSSLTLCEYKINDRKVISFYIK